MDQQRETEANKLREELSVFLSGRSMSQERNRATGLKHQDETHALKLALQQVEEQAWRSAEAVAEWQGRCVELKAQADKAGAEASVLHTRLDLVEAEKVCPSVR